MTSVRHPTNTPVGLASCAINLLIISTDIGFEDSVRGELLLGSNT
jgi:hypothetical protein